MDGLKRIMYGVTDFPRIRRENVYFVDYCSQRIDQFAEDHAKILPKGRDCHRKLDTLMTQLKGSGVNLSVIIDEYTNNVLLRP